MTQNAYFSKYQEIFISDILWCDRRNWSYFLDTYRETDGNRQKGRTGVNILFYTQIEGLTIKEIEQSKWHPLKFMTDSQFRLKMN